LQKDSKRSTFITIDTLGRNFWVPLSAASENKMGFSIIMLYNIKQHIPPCKLKAVRNLE